MTEEKKQKLHIKVYVRNEAEKKAIEDRAREEGYSASSWLRGMAIKKLRNKRKGDQYGDS